MNSRRAVSLIELIVAMSACTVILTTSAMLVHRVMHAHSRVRSFYDVERSAWRLSEQFGRDVHQARAAAVTGDPHEEGAFLRLQLTDGENLEYRHENGNVWRNLLRGDQTASRDEFSFPPNVRLAIREEDTPRRLTLSVTADPHTTPGIDGKSPWNEYSTRVSVEAAATVGRDWRFVAATDNDLQ
jgi:type II secretory pathway component PulJ